jgi:hypothetical protein
MTIFDITNNKIKTIKLHDEEFKISAIFPNEKVEISVKRSYLQNGMALESFSIGDIQMMDKIATIDVCVIDKPGKYEKWDTCRKWDDPYLIDLLYEKIKDHTSDIEVELKKNRDIKRN